MSSRENLLEICESMAAEAAVMRESLLEACEARLQWLRDVFASVDALDMKSRQSIRGDLLPKTPCKRGRKRKAKASSTLATEEAEAPSKKSLALVKPCHVRLFAMLSTSGGVQRDQPSTSSSLEPQVLPLPEPLPAAHSAVENVEVEECANVSSKPIKPPRKKRSTRHSSKENESPVKNVVPKGMVAARIEKYEEQIESASPKKPLSQILHLEPDLNVVGQQLASPKAVLQAKVVELQISRMSTSRQRSSRMRRKLKSSKAIIRRSSRYSVMLSPSGSSRRSVAASSPSLSFATANNSPVTNENEVEVADVVNETVDENVTQPSNDDVVASSGVEKDSETVSGAAAENIDEQAAQLDGVDGSDADVIMATPPSPAKKSNFGGGDMTQTRSLTACKVVVPSALRLSPRPAVLTTDSVRSKNRPVQRQNSFFGRKRNPSASPSGSTYRFGSTPDRVMTPMNDNLRYERKALLDARAESVLKKREEYLRQKVEDQKRKREMRLQRVALEKEKREKERVAKIEKQQEEERKKLIRRKQREEKRQLAEVERMRLYKQQVEEQRLIEQREREEAERMRAAEKMQEEKRIKEAASKIKKPEINIHKTVVDPVVEIENVFVKPGCSKQILDTTYNACGTPHNATFNADNYEMTPKDRPLTLANPENYDIDNLNEEDSTDEEDKPKKPIPAWADGEALKRSALDLWNKRLDIGLIFPKAEMFVIPNLYQIFKTRRKRFNYRTSSAVWDRPPRLNDSFNAAS